MSLISICLGANELSKLHIVLKWQTALSITSLSVFLHTINILSIIHKIIVLYAFVFFYFSFLHIFNNMYTILKIKMFSPAQYQWCDCNDAIGNVDDDVVNVAVVISRRHWHLLTSPSPLGIIQADYRFLFFFCMLFTRFGFVFFIHCGNISITHSEALSDIRIYLSFKLHESIYVRPTFRLAAALKSDYLLLRDL